MSYLVSCLSKSSIETRDKSLFNRRSKHRVGNKVNRICDQLKIDITQQTHQQHTASPMPSNWLPQILGHSNRSHDHNHRTVPITPPKFDEMFECLEHQHSPQQNMSLVVLEWSMHSKCSITNLSGIPVDCSGYFDLFE